MLKPNLFLLLVTIICLLFLETCSTSTSSPRQVFDLTAENFADNTKEGIWLISFYAPWCIFSKIALPVLQEVAEVVNDHWNVGQVNCVTEEVFCDEKKIVGYPMIFVYKDGIIQQRFIDEYLADRMILFVEKTEPGIPKTEFVVDRLGLIGRSKVKELKGTNFSKTESGVWLVQIYADWCEECSSEHLRILERVARSSKLFNVGRIEADEDALRDIEISEIPSLVLFEEGKMISKYGGAIEIGPIVDFVFGHSTTIREKRESSTVDVHKENGVFVLNEHNFDHFVREKNVFVDFYTTWCHYCKDFTPVLEELAAKTDYIFAKVDVTVEINLKVRFNIESFPMLNLFKADGSIVPFYFLRTFDNISRFLEEQIPTQILTDGEEVEENHSHDEL